MSHQDILSAGGPTSLKPPQGSLMISTLIEGSEITRAARHNDTVSNAMIAKASAAFEKWCFVSGPVAKSFFDCGAKNIAQKKRTLALS